MLTKIFKTVLLEGNQSYLFLKKKKYNQIT